MTGRHSLGGFAWWRQGLQGRVYCGAMASLHPLLEPALERLPGDASLHLLTRHSVREASTAGFADYRLALTEEGVALAEQWGARLNRPVARLTSSPVPRCVDTALAMARGARAQGWMPQDLTVEEAAVLVEPGSYVQDINEAGPAFFRLGAVDFINQHLGEGLRGVLSPAAGRDQLVRHMLDDDPEPGSLAVHVTHDTILAAFVAGLHEHARIEEQDWPWMMEGVWLWRSGDELHWIWRGEATSRPLNHVLVS